MLWCGKSLDEWRCRALVQSERTAAAIDMATANMVKQRMAPGSVHPSKQDAAHNLPDTAAHDQDQDARHAVYMPAASGSSLRALQTPRAPRPSLS